MILKVSTLTYLGIVFWFLLGFIGKSYATFGYDVLVYFFDQTHIWPGPIITLFPKMTKCEWSRVGFGGDKETRSALCQLPLNNVVPWTAFALWWALAVIFIMNLLSLLHYLIIFLCPCLRNRGWRKFVKNLCPLEVAILRKRGLYGLHEVIKVNLTFGDWLLLYFIENNLGEDEFRSFVRKVVCVQARNYALRLRSPEELRGWEDDIELQPWILDQVVTVPTIPNPNPNTSAHRHNSNGGAHVAEGHQDNSTSGVFIESHSVHFAALNTPHDTEDPWE
jgi:hypothetical protein